MKPLTMSAEQEKRDREKLTWTVNLNDRVTFELLGALMRAYRELDASRANEFGISFALKTARISNEVLEGLLTSEIAHADALDAGLFASAAKKAELQMRHRERRYVPTGTVPTREQREHGDVVVGLARRLADVLGEVQRVEKLRETGGDVDAALNEYARMLGAELES